VALELARRLGDVEIVTVDSMQVYRGMDIGTAKPTPHEQAEVPHHLIDLADPGEEWDVTRWAAAARSVLGAIESRGRRALVVGGTGLYFQALVDGLEPPGRFPLVRAELEAAEDAGSAAGGTARMHRRLAELDPLAAGRIEPGNRRRILRALEVCLGTGRPFSSFGPGMGSYRPTDWRIAGLWLPRTVVGARIDARLTAMVEAGLVAEVRTLAGRAGGLGRTAAQALGYREVLAHLAGETTLDDAVAEATRRTRAFARRQRVWWRRDPRVAWIGSPENPLAVIPALLGHWRQP
jgi:tRNA dimethylallyltransferase